jgi:hypothetical protein
VTSSARLITGKQVKNSSLTGKDIRNSSLTTSDVKNRSLLARDFKSGQVPAGAQGPKGDQGDPGPFPGTLPPGKTLRGHWALLDSAATANEQIQTAISYVFRLPSAPQHHFIGVGTTPPPQCPGSASDPEAAPGHMCYYESGTINASLRFGAPLDDPTVGSRVGIRSVAGGTYDSFGAWAVTSP